ncbi:class I tRNA ligase family protein [Mycoplasma sp. Pen4]|uniref:class I tRNA ligase family protein n=1 Tax=Mycoplasma sp. Pen4 TaxID=640330 RepID=UPI00165430B4|nr:class I tRNA ligase family protein [Mycoplasma sp. Pen4]QNM93359.1 class I tRNA ligase family protein [Mycoplasma sp. Pen4]
MLKVYVCGPTVYNDVHIGNLRPIITMDLMLKSARFLGIEFNFIHNITDIDDKIINKASELGVSEEVIAEKYSKQYLELLKNFNIDTISKVEYVTKNLNVITRFIGDLIHHKAAYTDDDGNVWFDVKKYKRHYGVVSNQDLDKMNFEDHDHKKRYNADFALWKNTTHGIKYESPFGAGRPGWHTECCALILKNFGVEGVDIHGGGMDLTFPHHENEAIQYFALTKHQLAKKWLRTGQINLNGIKMSKSLQNVVLAKGFLEEHNPDVLKMIFLLNGLTSIIDVNDDAFANVEAIFRKIKRVYFNAKLQNVDLDDYDVFLVEKTLYSVFEGKFSDFNKSVNDIIKLINTQKDSKYIASLIAIFNTLGFGFKDFDFDKFIEIYNQWRELLAEKDYETADKVRAILMENHLI